MSIPLAESLEIDGEVIVDCVRRLQTAKDSADALEWLEKIRSMTEAIRRYINRAAPTTGDEK